MIALLPPNPPRVQINDLLHIPNDSFCNTRHNLKNIFRAPPPPLSPRRVGVGIGVHAAGVDGVVVVVGVGGRGRVGGGEGAGQGGRVDVHHHGGVHAAEAGGVGGGAGGGEHGRGGHEAQARADGQGEDGYQRRVRGEAASAAGSVSLAQSTAFVTQQTSFAKTMHANA